MTDLSLAAICMTSTSDKDANIAIAERLVRRAAAEGADWVMLPEIFAYHGPYDKIYEMAEHEDGPLNAKMAKLARELKILLFAGTVGERPDRAQLAESELKNRDGHRRVFNTMYLFGRDGSMVGKYRKTHLFNLRDAAGRALYCESDGFVAGDAISAVTLEGFRVGLSICYDLRFPELFAKLSQNQPLDMIAMPSAFTQSTGMYHWELLLRARAVENLCYVFAANQTGVHSPGKVSFGHSMIIDPWGHKIADTGHLSGIALASVSHEQMAIYRSQLPALSNRRPELY